MRHFSKPAFGVARTFFDTLTIELEGSPKCGASIKVEVEFTATPDSFDPEFGQGEAGEREIVAIRPFEYAKRKVCDGVWVTSTILNYLDCPAWFHDYLRDCVDVDALDADWSEV